MIVPNQLETISTKCKVNKKKKKENITPYIKAYIYMTKGENLFNPEYENEKHIFSTNIFIH